MRDRRGDLAVIPRRAGQPDLQVVGDDLDAVDPLCGELWFAPGQAAAMARIQRLRAGLALNYAALGLVTDLLERIAVLESALRRARRPGG